MVVHNFYRGVTKNGGARRLASAIVLLACTDVQSGNRYSGDAWRFLRGEWCATLCEMLDVDVEQRPAGKTPIGPLGVAEHDLHVPGADQTLELRGCRLGGGAQADREQGKDADSRQQRASPVP